MPNWLRRLFGRKPPPFKIKMVPLSVVEMIIRGEEVTFPSYEVDISEGIEQGTGEMWYYSPSTNSVYESKAAREG